MHLIMNVEFFKFVIYSNCNQHCFSMMGLVVDILTDAFSVAPNDGLMCT